MTATQGLVEKFERGLDAPICLTWELTYACNLACVHCLSSSGKRDPRELSTAQCKAIIDELERMQVFYVNIGGGEPTVMQRIWAIYARLHFSCHIAGAALYALSLALAKSLVLAEKGGHHAVSGGVQLEHDAQKLAAHI